MNSAEAAEEGPNEPDTEPFFKTGGLGVSSYIYLCECVCVDGVYIPSFVQLNPNTDPSTQCFCIKA